MRLTLDDNTIHKAFGLPEGVDPNHEYVYRSGEHGIYEFWYKDMFENYWQYTNAPKDDPDFDPYSGEAIIVPDQPMPHTAPQFYTKEGRKLHAAVPQGADLIPNEAYDPLNSRSIWYGMYQSEDGESRFLYYDSDVRENLDLWIQYQLRVTDAALVRYRKFAIKLFESPHPKDKVIGFILMLVDQGVFEAYELTKARVEDVEYIDFTVKLLGKKIVCDPVLVDFFTSLTAGRDPSEPLFVLDTHMGRRPIGVRHIYSVFKSLRLSPHFLLYWHASHLYSRIVHRLAAEDTPVEEVEERAMNELARALNVAEDMSAFVDIRLQQTLMSNYAPLEDEDPGQESEEAPPGEEDQAAEAPDMNKALVKVTTDDFGVLTIYSDLSAKRPDEFEFSQWLHATPLHDMSDEEVEMMEAQLDMQKQEEESADNAPDESPEGAVAQNDVGTSPQPSDGDLSPAEEGEV